MWKSGNNKTQFGLKHFTQLQHLERAHLFAAGSCSVELNLIGRSLDMSLLQLLQETQLGPYPASGSDSLFFLWIKPVWCWALTCRRIMDSERRSSYFWPWVQAGTFSFVSSRWCMLLNSPAEEAHVTHLLILFYFLASISLIGLWR